jgi:isoleucyl-tRNA synthetase
VCLAHIVDRDGQKMSKTQGNVIDPWTILDTRGADALRWYFFSAGSPWTSRRVFPEGIDESIRHFILTLWNTYSFFVTYANLDGWEPKGSPVEVAGDAHVLDRWVRSRLHSTVRDVTEALEGFDALRGAQALETFVDDLSNWYVRRSRARFWKSADARAHATLHEALEVVTRLLAPFCPFLADEIHANLGRSSESVHLQDWPEADPALIDPALDADMEAARRLVTLGRAARTEAALKVRQPLRRAVVVIPGGAELSEAVVAEVADELNVKEVEAVSDLEGLLDFTVVPNFRAMGPKVGKLMPAVKAALLAADGAEVKRALETAGSYALTLDGSDAVVLTGDDVEVRAAAHQELALAQEGAYAVALDTTLDDDLRLEGLARELVRALNDLRKTQGLELSDRVAVHLRAPGQVAEAARRHGDWIATEVLAVEWKVDDHDADVADDGFTVITVDGTPVGVRVEVVARER